MCVGWKVATKTKPVLMLCSNCEHGMVTVRSRHTYSALASVGGQIKPLHEWGRLCQPIHSLLLIRVAEHQVVKEGVFLCLQYPEAGHSPDAPDTSMWCGMIQDRAAQGSVW